jgi:hypothetical protein
MRFEGFNISFLFKSAASDNKGLAAASAAVAPNCFINFLREFSFFSVIRIDFYNDKEERF